MECYSCYAFGDIGDYHCHDEYVPAASDTGVCETGTRITYAFPN